MTRKQEKKLIKELERVLRDVKDAHTIPCFKVNKDGVVLELNNIINMLNEMK